MVKEKKGIQLSYGFIDTIKDWFVHNEGDYLEIGCYYGVFFSEMAETHPQIKVYGIDPHISDAYNVSDKETLQKEVKSYFAHNIEGLDNVVFWNTKTENCLSDEYVDQLSNVSCILVDGSHIFEDILADIMLIKKIKSRHKILVIFDDRQIQDVLDSIDLFKKVFGPRIILEATYNNCSFFHLIPDA